MAQVNNNTAEEIVINSAINIAEYCRKHICTQCPLNLSPHSDSILKAHCVCDYSVLHLPSTWKIEQLKKEA